MIKLIDRWLLSIAVRLLGWWIDIRSEQFAESDLDTTTSIVVFKLGAIGDSVLLLPVLDEFAKNRPNSSITVISWQSNFAVYSSLKNSNIQLVNLGEYNNINGLINVMRYFWQQRGKFAVAIDCEQFANFTALLCYFVGAKLRIGFSYAGFVRSKLYNIKIPYQPNRYEPENFAQLFAQLYREIKIRPTVLKKVPNNNLRIAIHPFSKWRQKEWPRTKFLQLAKKLSCCPDVAAVDIISEGQDIEDFLHIPKVNLVSRIALADLATKLTQYHIMISNDNGIMHLAAYLGVPVVGIYAMSDPQQWHALGCEDLFVQTNAYCAPCNKLGRMKNCQDLLCMEDITVSRVLEKLRMLGLTLNDEL